MRVLSVILVLIIVLAIGGLFLIFRKDRDKSVTEIAIAVQAIATVVLVLVTGIYVIEVKKARISQEEGFGQYVAELQKARKQQVKPYIYPFFFWSENIGKFVFVLKNVGVGPAFGINYSYSVKMDAEKTINHKDICKILPAGEEKAHMTPFAVEHMAAKDPVTIEITYEDSFGQIFTERFEHNLAQLANNPPPSNFANHRRDLENRLRRSEIRLWIQSFLEEFRFLQKDVAEIKEVIKRRK
ncbi:hypothetical protein ACFL5X_03415 [Candidatus Omnitrophota bacterium]